MQRELSLINEEVQDHTTTATVAKKTFAAKWLNRAYRLCIFWNVLTGLTILGQILLFIITEDSAMIIPGQGYIYGGAGLVNGALVGGDAIVDKLTERLPKPGA